MENLTDRIILIQHNVIKRSCLTVARKAKKKTLSELDKSIVRELKKNRVFSKTDVLDITGWEDDTIFAKVLEAVNTLDNKVQDGNLIIYIIDQMVLDGDINLLLHVVDTYVFCIHRPDVYQRLKAHDFKVVNADLKFYDRL